MLCALLRAIKGQSCPARRVAGRPATDPSGPCGSAQGPLHRLAQLYRPAPGRGSPGARGDLPFRALGWTQAMRAYRLRLTMRLLRLVFSHPTSNSKSPNERPLLPVSFAPTPKTFRSGYQRHVRSVYLSARKIVAGPQAKFATFTT
jgi:hypothetical protein